MLDPLRDRFGFWFWLRWILYFAGSFVVSALCWTALLQFIFGRIQGAELTLTWTVSVFGSWFILVIPFMRKKEQIWKRLNTDQEKSVDAWFLGTSVFLGLLIASAFFWDLYFKSRLFPDSPGLDPSWAKAVFGTWLVLLIPLGILMYREADKIFRQAVDRQTYEPSFRSCWIESEKRRLPEKIASKIQPFKTTLPGGHVVKLHLKNGEVLPNVFILNGREVAGIYGYRSTHFDASEIEDVEITPLDQLPAYDESQWVRFNLTP